MKRCLIVIAALTLGACAAAERKKANEPSESASAAGGAPDYAVEPSQPAQPGYPGSPPPPPMPITPQATASAQPPSPSRQAGADLDRAQRELDVAAGDCQNACRALSSMDRAAGRICSLASGNDDDQRCSDAKTRVYSARDKVKNSCGQCAETSVDRNAPVPSTR